MGWRVLWCKEDEWGREYAVRKIPCYGFLKEKTEKNAQFTTSSQPSKEKSYESIQPVRLHNFERDACDARIVAGHDRQFHSHLVIRVAMVSLKEQGQQSIET